MQEKGGRDSSGLYSLLRDKERVVWEEVTQEIYLEVQLAL